MISDRDREKLQAISVIRGGNNRLWMALLEIALDCAPERTKEVLKGINSNDSAISNLLKDLAE